MAQQGESASSRAGDDNEQLKGLALLAKVKEEKYDAEEDAKDNEELAAALVKSENHKMSQIDKLKALAARHGATAAAADRQP